MTVDSYGRGLCVGRCSPLNMAIALDMLIADILLTLFWCAPAPTGARARAGSDQRAPTPPTQVLRRVQHPLVRRGAEGRAH